MSGRDTAGTYTAPTNSFNPAVTNATIDPADWNAQIASFITWFGTNSLDRTGKGAMQANLDFSTFAPLYRIQALTLVNGANADVTLTAGAFYRIAGPTGAFSISGLTAGVDGRMVRIFNPIAQNMTLTNDATSTGANRILTMTGADIATTGVGVATLIYSSTDTRWIVTSFQT